jgi:hypothetical protein
MKASMIETYRVYVYKEGVSGREEERNRQLKENTVIILKQKRGVRRHDSL